MSGRGWFRAYRKIFDPSHPIRMRQPLCPLAVWLDLVGQASHEPFVKDTGRDLVELNRGEFVASVRFLATRWKWSKDRTARHLKALQKRDMLAPLRETATGTVYLIVNYDFYNPTETEGATPSATAIAHEPRQKRDSGKDKEKNSKNRENKKNREAQKRASTLQEDWKPNDQHAALARELGVSVSREAESFRDHAAANRRLLVDWDAGFRSWLRKAAEFGRTTSPGSKAARIAGEKPRERGARGDIPARLRVEDGGAVDPVEQEIRDVRQWESKHSRAEREAVMAEASALVKNDPAMAHLAIAGDNVLRGAIEARYRKLVLEQIERAA